MFKVVLQIIAVLLIILGIITFPLPIPVGIVFIGIGLSLLILTSRKVRHFIRKYRDRYPDFNNFMHKVEKYTPKIISKIIHKTEPQ